MRSTLRSRLTFANLVSLIALFIALSGTAYALSVPRNSIGAKQIKQAAVQSAEVKNFSLNDEDISQGAFVNFTARIGTVDANTCRVAPITGVNVMGDHVLLTPNAADASTALIYTAEYTQRGWAILKTCNPTNAHVFDGDTHFNLLVIDAQ